MVCARARFLSRRPHCAERSLCVTRYRRRRWALARFVALLALSLPGTAGAAVHRPPFLSVARARHAMSEPGVTVRSCRRARRNAVGCVNEWAGGVEGPEAGSETRTEVFVWATLCRGHVYLLAGATRAPSCHTAINDQQPHVA
jgi:hypothetical protein